MNVAMVSEHASPLATLGGVDAGGQNVHVSSLARSLASARGTSVVVHTRRDDPNLPRHVRLCRDVTVDHVDAGPAVPLPKDLLLPLMDEFAEDLRRSWTIDTPDIVHAHFWMSALAALKAARPLDLPVVVTFHALGAEKRRHQHAADSSPSQRVDLEREIAGDADLVLATSKYEIGELGGMGAIPKRVEVVPCGVDASLFRCSGPAARRTPGLRRIVACGRLVERKGIEDVISALGDIPKTELVVIGGSEQNELAHDLDANRLRAHAHAVGNDARVRLIGRVPHRYVASIFRSADVVVCAPWYEPFGMVALEAMACGRPVVATHVGGLAETVVDGTTGLLVPPRDPAALGKAIRTLLADEARASAFGIAGYARVRALYTWERVAQATRRAYSSVTTAARVSGGLP